MLYSLNVWKLIIKKKFTVSLKFSFDIHIRYSFNYNNLDYVKLCKKIKRFRIFFFFWSFCLFRAAPKAHGGSQARGSNRSCSCRPTPEPQQCQIQAMSAVYTTAQGNAGSLTHWARPEIEPAASWFLVGFIAAAPQWELPIFSVINQS